MEQDSFRFYLAVPVKITSTFNARLELHADPTSILV